MAEAVSRPNFSPSNFTSAPTHHSHRRRQVAFSFSHSNRSPVSSYRGLILRSKAAASSSPPANSFNYYFHAENMVVCLGGKRANPNQPILQSKPSFSPTFAQMNTRIGIGKAQRWWEKGIQPNMKEVTGAQDLVDSLLNAGDKLLVVDFYSPGCGGCRALHPKICQLAELNPDVQFLQVNYETHKSMCYALNVHVLPFFRFYRGALGRLCSFSCTTATIKKFKDALAKYGADFCSLEPTKGLEEKELLALAANRDLSFNYTPKPGAEPEPAVVVAPEQEISLETSQTKPPLPLPIPLPSEPAITLGPSVEKRTLISSAR